MTGMRKKSGWKDKKGQKWFHSDLVTELHLDVKVLVAGVSPFLARIGLGKLYVSNFTEGNVNVNRNVRVLKNPDQQAPYLS